MLRRFKGKRLGSDGTNRRSISIYILDPPNYNDRSSFVNLKNKTDICKITSHKRLSSYSRWQSQMSQTEKLSGTSRIRHGLE